MPHFVPIGAEYAVVVAAYLGRVSTRAPAGHVWNLLHLLAGDINSFLTHRSASQSGITTYSVQAISCSYIVPITASHNALALSTGGSSHIVPPRLCSGSSNQLLFTE